MNGKVVLFIACICAFQSLLAESQRPNILLIMVDDVGYADINAFASRLRGTPTRASLLTGKMANRMGMWDAIATTKTTLASN